MPCKLAPPPFCNPLQALQLEACRLDDFEVGRVLGTGSFGRVSLARHRGTGMVCAIKALSKAHIVKNQQARVPRCQVVGARMQVHGRLRSNCHARKKGVAASWFELSWCWQRHQVVTAGIAQRGTMQHCAALWWRRGLGTMGGGPSGWQCAAAAGQVGTSPKSRQDVRWPAAARLWGAPAAPLGRMLAAACLLPHLVAHGC